MALVSDSHKFIFIHVPKTAGTSIESALRCYCTAESLARPGVDPHETVTQARARIGHEKFDKYFKFTVIRDPYSREISYFCYGFQQLLASILKEVASEFFNCKIVHAQIEHASISVACSDGIYRTLPAEIFCKWETMIQRLFKEWACGTFDPVKYQISAQGLQAGKPFMGSPHGTQSSYLCDITGRNLVNYTLRYEHIDEDFALLCERLGIPNQRLPSLLSSKKLWPEVVRTGTLGKHYMQQLFYDDEINQLLWETYQQDFGIINKFL